jgi:hypothetical protein
MYRIRELKHKTSGVSHDPLFVCVLLVFCGLPPQQLEIGSPNISFSVCLRLEKLREHLEITPEQTEPVLELVSEIVNRTLAASHASLEIEDRRQRQQKYQDLLKPIEEYWSSESKKRLGPEQLRRLRQLELQSRDLGACEEPVIREALRISDSQNQQIQRALELFRREIDAQLENPLPKDVREINRLRDESLSRLRAILTEEQLRTWKEIIGTPIRIEEMLPAPRAQPSPGPVSASEMSPHLWSPDAKLLS